MSAIHSVPRWDLTPIFPGIESVEVKSTFNQIVEDIESLALCLDQFGVRRLDSPSVNSELV
ncbi:MAG: hypothetical protein ABJA67_10835, partial [Chthonomonadales bacterium]